MKTMDGMSRLGYELRAYRAAHHITQNFMKEILGVCLETYYQWECRGRMPGAGHLVTIAGILGIPLEEVMAWAIEPADERE